MQFNADAFNRMLGDIGQKVLWKRAYACPCINQNSGAAKPGCPVCLGKGRIWDAPVQCLAGVGGAKAQRKFAQLGVWLDGDTTVTVASDQPIYAIGQYDRVVLSNATLPFSQDLVHGAPNEKLNFGVASIIRVFWLNVNGTQIVPGGIPKVNADGTLTFPTGSAPPAGQTYSITGTRQAEYYCYTSLPTNRNDFGGVQLPRVVLLRNFDLFGR
jgi:hypothetical protein